MKKFSIREAITASSKRLIHLFIQQIFISFLQWLRLCVCIFKQTLAELNRKGLIKGYWIDHRILGRCGYANRDKAWSHITDHIWWGNYHHYLTVMGTSRCCHTTTTVTMGLSPAGLPPLPESIFNVPAAFSLALHSKFHLEHLLGKIFHMHTS